jgi:hypothetical protein
MSHQNPAAAMRFAAWSQSEATDRIRKLLAAGWSTHQIGRMFGIRVDEIERLVGREPRTVVEVA